MTQAERILEARKAARNGAFYSDVIERTPLDLHMDRARLECGHEATVLAASAPPRGSRATRNKGPMVTADLAVHPAADLFPLLEGQELLDLAEDIRQRGLHHPILLHPDGSILDGRNRYRACKLVGVEPVFETWDGVGSLIGLVVSLNIQRRHLDKSQRSMLAAKTKPLFAEEARKRMLAATAAAAIVDAARKAGVRTPILDGVFSVLYKGKPAASAMRELLDRDPRPENS